jgi:hypothetical protein
MSLSSISPQLSRSLEPSSMVNPRLQVKEGAESTCMSTVLKVATIAALVIVALGAFVVLGPIIGVVALVCGAGLILLFNSCCNSQHTHHRAPPQAPVSRSWFDFSAFVPSFLVSRSHDRHVPVGTGQHTPTPVFRRDPAPHVPVGTGQRTPPQGRRRDDELHVPIRSRGH